MLMNPTSVAVGAFGPIDTATVSGVTPLAGLTTSQLLFENADIVTFACPVEDVIWSACVGAVAPLKISCGGLAVKPCARAESIEHATAATKTASRNQDI